MNPIPASGSVFSILEYNEFICAFGFFNFISDDGDEGLSCRDFDTVVNNAVCGDGTYWFETLYGGIEGPFIEYGLVSPDGNLYLLDSTSQLLMFDGVTWSTLATNIYLLGLYFNPKVELLDVKTRILLWEIIGAVGGGLALILGVLATLAICKRRRNRYIKIPTDLRDSDELIANKIQSRFIVLCDL